MITIKSPSISDAESIVDSLIMIILAVAVLASLKDAEKLLAGAAVIVGCDKLDSIVPSFSFDVIIFESEDGC